MTNIIEVSYNQTGESKTTNSLGMREMQAKAYGVKNEQYILLKAPPASGKSRALMFMALDKLYNLKKLYATNIFRFVFMAFYVYLYFLFHISKA